MPTSSAPEPLNAFWWFDLHWAADQRPGLEPDVAWEPITSATLAIGRMDGEPVAELTRTFPEPQPFTSFRSLEPYARRVASEGVAFGYFDGARSTVEWVDARSGEGDVIFTSDQPIHNAIVSKDRQTLYAVLLDAQKRTEVGVWAFDLAGEDTTGTVLLPATRFDPANQGLIEELYLTPDESTLLVRDCYSECRVRLVDLGTGEPRTVKRGLPTNTSVRGVTNTRIVYDANCDLPCHLAALDLETGNETPVGWACSSAVVIASSGGPMIVGDGGVSGCMGSLRIVATPVDPVDPFGQPTEVFKSDVADAALVPLGDQFDAALPDGSFLVAAGENPVREQPPGFPLLVDATTGNAMQLPELRSR